MKKPVYTVEYKVKAVELLKSSEKSQSCVAKDLGISDSTLSK
jgi:transposase-like protein